MEHHLADCKALLSDLKEQENDLRLKRRWLMDLPLSEREQKRMRKINPFLAMSVPETLLREDDGNHARLSTPTESFRYAAVRVLDRLEKLPTQTLIAMNRKLKGIIGYIPKLQHKKGPKRSELMVTVRNRCMKMLRELDKGKEPREGLVKALAVAGLTLKLILGHPFETEFQKFSPEIEALQFDIAKAIGLSFVDNKVSSTVIKSVLKKLRHPSDPDVDLKSRRLRFALRNLLFEYLFECSDMDFIPEPLLEALAEIKKRSHSSPCGGALKEKVEGEVEALLCLSAQTKLIIWDSHQQGFDEDFANAYMEDLEESDGDSEEVVPRQNCQYHLYNVSPSTESIGENYSIAYESPTSTCKRNGVSALHSLNSRLNVKLESVDISERDSVQSRDFEHYPCDPKSKMSDCTPPNLNSTEPELQNSDKCRTSMPSVILTVDQNEFSPVPDRRSGNGHEVKREETVNDSVEIENLAHSCSLHGETGMSQCKQCANGNKYLSIQKACDEASMVVYRIIGGLLHVFAKAQHVNLRDSDLFYLQTSACGPNNPKVSEKKQSSDDAMCNSLSFDVFEELGPSLSECCRA